MRFILGGGVRLKVARAQKLKSRGYGLCKTLGGIKIIKSW